MIEHIGSIQSFKKRSTVKNKHLHTANHLLADELSKSLRDPKHFGFYLKMTTLYDHNFLRKTAAEILEKKNIETPGRLFAYLIKKHNDESKNQPST